MNALTDHKQMIAERRLAVPGPQIRRFIARATLWTFAALGFIATSIFVFDLALIAMINRLP